MLGAKILVVSHSSSTTINARCSRLSVASARASTAVPNNEMMTMQRPCVVITSHTLLTAVMYPHMVPLFCAVVATVGVATTCHRVVCVDAGVIISDQPTVIHVAVGDFIRQLACDNSGVAKPPHCRSGYAIALSICRPRVHPIVIMVSEQLRRRRDVAGRHSRGPLSKSNL